MDLVEFGVKSDSQYVPSFGFQHLLQICRNLPRVTHCEGPSTKHCWALQGFWNLELCMHCFLTFHHLGAGAGGNPGKEGVADKAYYTSMAPAWYVRSYHSVLCPVTEPSPGVPGQAGGLAGHPSSDGTDTGQACTVRHNTPKVSSLKH